MEMETKMKEKMKEMEYKPYELNENGGIKKGVLMMNDMPNKEIIDTMPMQNANHKKYDYDYIREQIQTAISALEQVKDSMSYRSNLFDKSTNKPINYDAKQYIEDIIINLDNFLYNFSIVVPKDPKIFL